MLAEDIEEIARAHVQSWQEAYRGQVPDAFLDSLTVASRVKMWSGVFDTDNMNALVAVEDDAIVGFTGFGPSRDDDPELRVGEVQTIYVLQDWWGRGVGPELMKQALAHFASTGTNTVRLWALGSNERALAFYGKFGFSLDGEEKTVERPGFELHEVRLSVVLQ